MINSYSNRYMGWKMDRVLRLQFTRAARAEKDGKPLSIPAVRGKQPVIVLGMHRSGTTMLSNILRQMGIYMGWLRGTDTDESIYFQNLNRAIYRFARAAWDEPAGLAHALQNQKVSQLFAQTLGTITDHVHPAYLGRYRNHKSLFTLPIDWGFKDPRTVFTYPVWQQLFPEAKLIFIYRHGVDVANSLHTRNWKMLDTGAASLRCLELMGAFGLWEEYNEACIDILSSTDKSRTLSLCYEDLLRDPQQAIHTLREFLGSEISEEKAQGIVSGLQPARAFAYRQNDSLQEFYLQVRNRPLMQHFAYDSL